MSIETELSSSVPDKKTLRTIENFFCENPLATYLILSLRTTSVDGHLQEACIRTGTSEEEALKWTQELVSLGYLVETSPGVYRVHHNYRTINLKLDTKSPQVRMFRGLNMLTDNAPCLYSNYVVVANEEKARELSKRIVAMIEQFVKDSESQDGVKTLVDIGFYGLDVLGTVRAKQLKKGAN